MPTTCATKKERVAARFSSNGEKIPVTKLQPIFRYDKLIAPISKNDFELLHV